MLLYISGEVGLIGKLKINNFLSSEKAACEKDKKGKKRELNEAKAQRLRDCMMKEQQGVVTSSTMQELFQTHQAQQSVDAPARRAAARAGYEKNGIVFKLTVPAKEHLADQKHFKFYQENIKKSLLQELDFKLVSSQPATGGRTEDKLRVQGSFLRVVFEEREASKEDLRLDGARAGRPDLRTGPYGCTQFMSCGRQEAQGLARTRASNHVHHLEPCLLLPPAARLPLHCDPATLWPCAGRRRSRPSCRRNRNRNSSRGGWVGVAGLARCWLQRGGVGLD